MLKLLSLLLILSLSLYSQSEPNKHEEETGYDIKYRDGYTLGYESTGEDGISDGYQDAFPSEEEAKVIVRRFTASWCGYCRKYAPIFEKVKEQYKNNSDVFFITHYSDHRADAEDFAQAEKFGVRGIPTTVITLPIKDNKVIFNQSGILSEKSLKKRIKRALKSAKRAE